MVRCSRSECITYAGAFCTKYFVRTPQFELPPWDVITFNYGLHDGADTNASYTANMNSIADQLVATASLAAQASRTCRDSPPQNTHTHTHTHTPVPFRVETPTEMGGRVQQSDSLGIAYQARSPAAGKPSKLIYFQTTIPGGANSVPGEPVSPSDQRVIELNAIAAGIMASRKITVVDLYATMTQCGTACKVGILSMQCCAAERMHHLRTAH